MTEIDLAGQWRVGSVGRHSRAEFCDAAFDDSAWATTPVPSLSDTSAQGGHDDTLLIRHRFEASAQVGARSFIKFDQVFGEGNVWFDGSYRGDIDGYFAPHFVEITESLKESDDHVVALELSPNRPTWASTEIPQTAIPGPVRIIHTGSVRIARLKVLCPEASADRAVLSLQAELHGLHARDVEVRTRVVPAPGTDHPGVEHQFRRSLSAGGNRLGWSVLVEQPELWWPWELGEQPLFDVTVEIIDTKAPQGPSDTTTVRTGLRHVLYDRGRFSINGTRLFLKGIGSGAMGQALTPTDASGATDALGDLRDAGANLIHCQSWVYPPQFYDAADSAGILVFQALPTAFSGGGSKPSGRLARQAVETLGHHPGLAVWVRRPDTGLPWRPHLASVKRTTEKADISRPSIGSPDQWAFEKAASEGLAAFVAKWSHRTRLVAFSAPARETDRYVEALRKLKYRPIGGFIATNATPALLQGACSSVRIAVRSDETPLIGKGREASIHVINDLHRPIMNATLEATLTLGGQVLEWKWAGDVDADGVAYIGTLRFTPPSGVTEASLEVSLRSAGATAHRHLKLNVR